MIRSPDAPPCSPGWLWASFNDVEHPCQKCGTTVEDGRPFCPQCRAPQIHVQVAIPDAEVAAGLNPAADEFSPEIPVETRLASSQTRQASSGSTMDRGIAVRAALKAGVLGVFIGMIPFLGMVLTGALAVFFYRRENRVSPPTALGIASWRSSGSRRLRHQRADDHHPDFCFSCPAGIHRCHPENRSEVRSKRGGP